MPFQNLYRLASDDCIELAAPGRTADAEGNVFSKAFKDSINTEEWDSWVQWDATEVLQSPQISSASSISESGIWGANIEEAGEKSMVASFESACSFDDAPFEFKVSCQSVTLELTPEPQPQQNLPTFGGYATLITAEEHTLLDIAMPYRMLAQVKIGSEPASPTTTLFDSAPPSPTLEIQSRKSRKRKISTDDKVTTPGLCESRKRGHNAIEKRYRTNLNDKINRLRLAIPSLCRKNSDCRDIEEEDSNGEKLDGKAEQKYGKAAILTQASDYIKTLERNGERLGNEVAELKTRVASFERLALSGNFYKFKNSTC